MSLTKPQGTVGLRQSRGRGAPRQSPGQVPALPHQRSGEPPSELREAAGDAELIRAASVPPGTATISRPLEVGSRGLATGGRRSRPATAVLVHVALVAVVGVLAALLSGAAPLTTAVVVGLVLAIRFHDALDVLRPELPGPGQLIGHASVPLAVAALGSGFGLLAAGSIRPVALTIAAALAADLAVTALRCRQRGPVRMVVVGCPDTISDGVGHFSGRQEASVVGGLVLDHQPEAGFDGFGENRRVSDGVPVARIADVDDVLAWAEHWDAELVVVLPGARLSSDTLRMLGWQLEASSTALAVSGVLDSVAPHRIHPRRVAGSTVIESRSSVPASYERAAKWLFDRTAGLLLLAIAALPIAFCWLLVRLDSRGPGLFRQERIGRDGRPFTMLKMRTMRTDAESVKSTLTRHDEGNGVLFKMRRDPRITRVGAVLRKFSLDELPQLVNVVRGEMSLVGPRPALAVEVEAYDDETHRRYAVRPGMTGLWQVSGRSDLSWEASKELDLYYVDNYRLSGDLLIGLRTIGAVAGSKGAY